MIFAGVVKLGNTHDSKSCAVRLEGSTPSSGIKQKGSEAAYFLFVTKMLDEFSLIIYNINEVLGAFVYSQQ